ncbi:hypothetical protein RDWZM_004121 [Blomia tropicalis]|uniref:Uncharacterized protein n=1 Tax=Blomia tropicalis TaxID=40697 RepID=A0A9Q0RT79_BLOTA|nr:hypothetical protein RDWZM_004121 [Blomia tropicalis]
MNFRGRRGFQKSPSSHSLTSNYSGRSNINDNVPIPVGKVQPLIIKPSFPHGTNGRPINLVSNFYKLSITETTIYHYDVNIQYESKNVDVKNLPEIETLTLKEKKESDSDRSDSPLPNDSEEVVNSVQRLIQRHATEIFNQFVSENEQYFQRMNYVFDGSRNLYVTEELGLPTERKTFQTKLTMRIENRPASFCIKLRMVEMISTKDIHDFYSGSESSISERSISIYEIIFRSIMAKNYELFQRKFFDLSTAQSSARTKLTDYVSGFTSAVRLTEFGLALNLHQKTSCIVARSFTDLISLVSEIARVNLAETQQPLTHYQMKDINRFIRHLCITTTHSNFRTVYKIDSLVSMTPYDVTFTSRGKKITVAEYFREVYRLQVQKLPLVKTTRKSIFFPLEVCRLVPNQFINNMKMNNYIQRELLLKATNPPNVYFKRLTSVAEKLSESCTNMQKEFGVELCPEPIRFQGRVLPLPKLLNGDNHAGFYKVQPPPSNWAVVCFDHRVDDKSFISFVQTLMDRAKELSLNMSTPEPLTKVEIRENEHVYNVFKNLSQQKNIQFVLVGIPSLNGKLDGLNAVVDPSVMKTLAIDSERTMVIGIDVNHPSETERLASSVASAVGSIDPMFSKYHAAIRVQKKERNEIITEMNSMIMELCTEFFNANRFLPDNLIIFRDGVSEGQFDKIYKTEIPLIEAAINNLGKPMKIMIIVTQKMHNTRFAMVQPTQMGRRQTYNVPSGTVVDNTITNPLYKMFYLNSHFSQLGTSRSTKYVILRDDLNLCADEIQHLCFVLCYNSIRTRSIIAIPTAARYADLCAYRSKLHIEAQLEITNISADKKKLKIEDFEKEMIKQLNRLVKVYPSMKNRLYYC